MGTGPLWRPCRRWHEFRSSSLMSSASITTVGPRTSSSTSNCSSSSIVLLSAPNTWHVGREAPLTLFYPSLASTAWGPSTGVWSLARARHTCRGTPGSAPTYSSNPPYGSMMFSTPTARPIASVKLRSFVVLPFSSKGFNAPPPGSRSAESSNLLGRFRICAGGCHAEVRVRVAAGGDGVAAHRRECQEVVGGASVIWNDDRTKLLQALDYTGSYTPCESNGDPPSLRLRSDGLAGVQRHLLRHPRTTASPSTLSIRR